MSQETRFRKGNIALIIVLVVAALSVAAIVWFMNSNSNESTNTQANANTNAVANANTNIDTSSWKTYTNTKFGYSFSYPDDWQLNDDPMTLVPNPEVDSISFGGQTGSIYVRVPNFAPGYCDSLNSCVEKAPYARQSQDISSGLQASEVGGIPALFETIRRPQTGNWIHHVYYLYPEGRYMMIYNVSSIPDDARTKPTYDAIVATFKFNR